MDLVFLMMLLAVSSTTVAEAESPAPMLAKAFAHSGLSGFCAVAFDKNGIRGEYVGGVADPGSKRPCDLDTVQPVASVSKAVLGLVLAQLRHRIDPL